MKKPNPNNEKTLISTLLAEYDECQNIKNHYNSRRWTIGAVAVLFSLGFLLFSFRLELIIIVFSAIFSIGILLAWYQYAHHVNPYVLSSLDRCHQIEKELENLNCSIKQNRANSLTKNRAGSLKVTKITQGIFSLITIIWIALIAKKVYDQMSLAPSTIFAITSVAILYYFLKWFEKHHADENAGVFTVDYT